MARLPMAAKHSATGMMAQQLHVEVPKLASRWLGDVDHADMPALLNAADVMIHTSEREGAPLTYREAQGCRLAVVATDIPASREAIDWSGLSVDVPTRYLDTALLRTLTHNVMLYGNREG